MSQNTKSKLSAEEKRVIEEKGTERPFTGKYDDFFEAGKYVCRKCGADLYRSEDKFDAHCGWPAFDDEVPGAIKRVDGLYTEIECANCGAHLGHVFEGERLTDKNVRHCVNSISMKFIPEDNKMEKAYFAGGCFWCIEAVMKRLKGVMRTVSGYTGGDMKNPKDNDIYYGDTGHAETVEVTFSPKTISFETLLDVFFTSHDPTSLNRQGADVGKQYRSAIFYTTEEQKNEAEKYIKKLEEGKLYDKPIITEIKKLDKFYPAEDHHQNYYDNNKFASYCQIVINPKLKKLKKNFSKYLKK